MFKIGEDTAKVYAGASEIQRIYFGSSLVYELVGEGFNLRDETIWEVTGAGAGATRVNATVAGYPQALEFTATANFHRLNLINPFTPPASSIYEYALLYTLGSTGQVRFTLKNATDSSEESVKGTPGSLADTTLLTVTDDTEISTGVWRLRIRASLDSAKSYEPGFGPNAAGDIVFLDFDRVAVAAPPVTSEATAFLAVDPSGNDGSGSTVLLSDHSGDTAAAIAAARAAPFATPQAAAEAASTQAAGASGAVAVLIEDGTYSAPNTSTPVLHILPTSSGTATAPIIVTAINRRQVTFEGPTGFSCVRADGGKYLELHGCVIVGNDVDPDNAPIKCEDGSSDDSTPLHLTFADNLLTGIGNDGVKCGTVSNIFIYGNEWSPTLDLDEEGLDFVSVADSEVKWNSVNGRLMVKGGSKSNLIEANRVTSNREAALDGEPGLSRASRTMWTGFPWSEASDNTWRYNVLETTANGRPPMWCRASDGSSFIGNLFIAPDASNGVELSRAKSAYYQGKSYADVSVDRQPYTSEVGAPAGEYYGWCNGLTIQDNFVAAGMGTGTDINADQDNNHTISGTSVGVEGDIGVPVGPSGWDEVAVRSRVGLQ